MSVVVVGDTGELAERAGLSIPTFLREILPAIEVGWRLGDRYRGRGYATEAGSAWVSYGFEQLGLDRIVSSTNPAMRRLRGQTVVAVCHAGVIMASMRVLLGIPHPGTGARLRPTNTGLTEWEHDASLDRWMLHSFNDAAISSASAPVG